MDLLVLAIGLVLGGLCVYVLLRLRTIERQSDDSNKRADLALETNKNAWEASKRRQEQVEKHDHEIAALYDKTNMRRG